MKIAARFALHLTLPVIFGLLALRPAPAWAQSTANPALRSSARAADSGLHPAVPGANVAPGAPHGPDDWLRTQALSPDGRLFITSDLDRRVRLWDVETGQRITDLPVGALVCIFSPDSRLLACELPARPRRWQLVDTSDGHLVGEPLAVPGEALGGPEGMTFSPDGKYLAAPADVSDSTAIALWDAANGKFIGSQPAREIASGAPLAFSADGHLLAAAGASNAVPVWNVPDLKRLQTLPVGESILSAAAFSPDGRLLVIGGRQTRTLAGKQGIFPSARVFDPVAGKVLYDLKIYPDPGVAVREICFADNGNAIVTADDKAVQAFSVQDGRLLAHVPDASYPVAISSDGRLLAGSLFPDLAFWDAATWTRGQTIESARLAAGLGPSVLPDVPLVFGVAGRVIGRREDAVTVWDASSKRVLFERKATQNPPTLPPR